MIDHQDEPLASLPAQIEELREHLASMSITLDALRSQGVDVDDGPELATRSLTILHAVEDTLTGRAGSSGTPKIVKQCPTTTLART